MVNSHEGASQRGWSHAVRERERRVPRHSTRSMSEGGLNKLKQPFSEFLPSSFREELVYTGTIELYSGTARPQQTSQDPINNRLNKLPFGPRWP